MCCGTSCDKKYFPQSMLQILAPWIQLIPFFKINNLILLEMTTFVIKVNERISQPTNSVFLYWPHNLPEFVTSLF